MRYKVTDEKGNCCYLEDEKLAMKIFMVSTNPFNSLEMVEEEKSQDIIHSLEEFYNHFY